MAKFNSLCPDRKDIRYFSFGASFKPTWGSVFRSSHKIIESQEGENDGLVSVKSAIWGDYKGTIPDVNHLDIINWVRALLLYFLQSVFVDSVGWGLMVDE